MPESEEPSRERLSGLRYLALEAVSDLSQDVIRAVHDSGDEFVLELDVQAFERALLSRRYSPLELLEIQTILANRLLTVTRVLQKRLSAT